MRSLSYIQKLRLASRYFSDLSVRLLVYRHCSKDAVKANKALHWTAIPLRSIAAGELGRYAVWN
jgi:hypothetical protein